MEEVEHKYMWEYFSLYSIWLYLPLIIAVVIALGVSILSVTHMSTSPLVELKTNRKLHSPQNIYNSLDHFSMTCIFILLILLSLPFIVWLDECYYTFIEGMLDYIDAVATIVIGLTAITITLSVMGVVFDKGYYIVFSIHEVLQKYRVSYCLVCSVITCFAACVATITLLGQELQTTSDAARFIFLEVATVCNFAANFYIILVIIFVIFDDNRRELSLLNQLYRVFSLSEIDFLHFKPKSKWSKFAVDANVRYLAEKYINICNKRKISSIEKMEFVTTIGYHKSRWYYRAVSKYKLVVVITFGLSLLSNYFQYNNNSYITAVNIVVTELLLIFPFSPMYDKHSDKVSKSEIIIMRLCSDTWGHLIKSRNSKDRFIPRVPFIPFSIYYRYIKAMYSLIAFYNLSLKYGEKRANIIEQQFGRMLQYFEDLKDKNIVTYSPAFVIGYLFFIADKKVDTLKDIYKQVVINANEQYEFEKMIDSQIFYMTKYCCDEFFEYRESLYYYLCWLKKR